MLIIPISHEHQRVKRYPWVTFSIMGICILSYFWVAFQAPSEYADPMKNIQEAQDYFIQHPHIDLSREAKEIIFRGFDRETREGLIEMYRNSRRPPRTSVVRMKQQREFEALLEKTSEIVSGPIDDLYRRWGLVPTSPTAVSFITHMFMHGGFMHLLGNMFLLYLTGPYLEDVWGRWIYSGFYLISGLLAAETFILHQPELDLPLIGASGAVAGLMGAFLVRYWKTRIRFFYYVMFFIHGTFMAPAWLMLPLWLVSQFFMASLTSSSMAQGGVAYWAHIGGFTFGAMIAWGIKGWDIEERYLRPVLGPGIDEPIVENKIVELAMDAYATGNVDRALEILTAELKSDPSNDDAALALWNVAIDRGRAVEVAPALLRVIDQELRSGQTDLAIEHWLDLTNQVPDVKANPMLCIRMARTMAGSGDKPGAAAALRLALLGQGSGLHASIALRIARESMRLEPQVAMAAVRLALSRPELTQEERAAAELLERQLKAQARSGAPVPVG